MAKKAEGEGLTFAAKQISKAQTLEGARKALANAKARAGEIVVRRISLVILVAQCPWLACLLVVLLLVV